MIRFHILPERPEDAALIEPLLDRSFGPERKEKTVYRLREGIAPAADLCFVAVDDDGRLLASLRFWPVRIGEAGAVLLGPLAVEPALQGRGLGRALLRQGLGAARRRGERICLVVGEPAYYAPYGFVAATPMGLVLSGPVEQRRFQVLEIVPGALEGVSGTIQRATDEAAPAGRRGGEVA